MPKTVVRLRIVRPDCNRSLQHFASFIPALLLAISVAQIFEGNQMIGTQPERLLKVPNRLGGAPFPRGQKAEVVPSIRQGVGIARAKFDRAFKALPGFPVLVLFQIDAPQAVESLGARWIVATGPI